MDMLGNEVGLATRSVPFVIKLKLWNLFFTCPVARIAWRVMGSLLGTSRCPRNCGKRQRGFMPFCLEEKKFMVGLAAVCWSIWTIRNKITFEEHVLRSPVEAVIIICSFLLYCEGSHVGDGKCNLADGARKMMKTAAEVTRRSHGFGGQQPFALGD
jgi:hypothetical protein